MVKNNIKFVFKMFIGSVSSHLSVFSSNARKNEPEKLGKRTLFMEWKYVFQTRFKSKCFHYNYMNKWIENIHKSVYHKSVNVNLVVENEIQIKSGITIKCRCRCKNPKKHYLWEKDYTCNPAKCSCKNGQYLAYNIIDDSVIMCDEIVEEIKTISIKNCSNSRLSSIIWTLSWTIKSWENANYGKLIKFTKSCQCSWSNKPLHIQTYLLVSSGQREVFWIEKYLNCLFFFRFQNLIFWKKNR